MYLYMSGTVKPLALSLAMALGMTAKVGVKEMSAVRIMARNIYG